VSASSIWEIAIKASLRRIDFDDVDLEDELKANDFVELPIQWRHGRIAGSLPRHHQDPFDRMLIAQAQTENLVLVSYDESFRRYDVALMPPSPFDRRITQE